MAPPGRPSTWSDDVLRFWFDELTPRQWWNATPEIDDRVRMRFGALHESLARDPPPRRDLDGRGHVAAVLVLDQFARHLFRGSAEAFATDPQALAVTMDAIERGLDLALDVPLRQFLYMPLMHSEDPAVQRLSLRTFTALGDADALRSAAAHHATIERFARFPYRNAALGRTSTDAERAELARRPRPE